MALSRQKKTQVIQKATLYPVLLQKHRAKVHPSADGKPPSQEDSSELFPLNHGSPTRGPGAACGTSVYFKLPSLWSYSNHRMGPGSVSKKFLKLNSFSAKVLRFKKDCCPWMSRTVYFNFVIKSIKQWWLSF